MQQQENTKQDNTGSQDDIQKEETGNEEQQGDTDGNNEASLTDEVNPPS